jgi:hypothetical protein
VWIAFIFLSSHMIRRIRPSRAGSVDGFPASTNSFPDSDHEAGANVRHCHEAPRISTIRRREARAPAIMSPHETSDTAECEDKDR